MGFALYVLYVTFGKMSKTNFLEELRWRGMLHNNTPDVEEYLQSGMATAYYGVDPTAPSLTVGNLAAFMMLMHFQRAGHKPIALVGGATGMVGDPSGKKEERQLLDEETLNYNISRQREVLEKLLDFNVTPNGAELVNNYDWFKNIGLLEFLRDTGKHISVNYMIAKDSVQNRLETGISYTEFTYQLIQAYDFKWLLENRNCKLQVGGSDQWGNITSGIELVRRTGGGQVHAITCPLITKADGTKFGKTEEGAVWLSADMTSPYKFYQFWLNASDEDAAKFIRIFTFLDKTEVEALEAEHAEAPHLRALQKRLAREATTLIHGVESYENAVLTSKILFGKATRESLQGLNESQLLEVFKGVPTHNVAKSDVENHTQLLDFLAVSTNIYSSKGEARRSVQGNSVSINKEKISDMRYAVSTNDLLNDKYILVQKGKKNYHLVIVE